jgi:hypothetical protein
MLIIFRPIILTYFSALSFCTNTIDCDFYPEDNKKSKKKNRNRKKEIWRTFSTG